MRLFFIVRQELITFRTTTCRGTCSGTCRGTLMMRHSAWRTVHILSPRLRPGLLSLCSVASFKRLSH